MGKRRHMERDISQSLHGKVTVMGIGNPLLGDDGLGPALVHNLAGCAELTCIDAGTTPGNQMGPIVNSHADTVLLVDAVDYGLRPGAFVIDDPMAVDMGNTSTHDVGLPSITAYLRNNTDADVYLFGVQPKQTILGKKISSCVRRTLSKMERVIRKSAESSQSKSEVTTRGDR